MTANDAKKAVEEATVRATKLTICAVADELEKNWCNCTTQVDGSVRQCETCRVVTFLRGPYLRCTLEVMREPEPWATKTCRLCQGESIEPWLPGGRLPRQHTCHPGEERQMREMEARMTTCTYHVVTGYADPEGDGCPECGWGGK